jgi:hypothetical protein
MPGAHTFEKGERLFHVRICYNTFFNTCNLHGMVGRWASPLQDMDKNGLLLVCPAQQAA